MNHAATSSNLAFVFPGQGSQSIGMLAELSELHRGIRETFAEASDGASVDLWALSQGGPEAMLNRTEYTQPALLAAGVAVWRAWIAAGGPRPAHLAGHSLGEYTALVAAGTLSLARRGASRAHPRPGRCRKPRRKAQGAMAAVLGAEDAARRGSLPRNLGRAHRRAGELQLAGTDRDRRTRRRSRSGDRALTARGVRKVVKLAVSVPSHTPLMREAANRVVEAMSAYAWREPQIPVVQNVDATAHRGVAAIRDALARQLYLPVRWSGCVAALATAGATRIAECGPGKVLAGLVKRIDKSIDGRALGTPAEFDTALESWRS